jgi:hypothetical protein
MAHPSVYDFRIRTLDGESLPDGALLLINDQREHTLEVLFAPCTQE